jgi:hypothetical protein
VKNTDWILATELVSEVSNAKKSEDDPTRTDNLLDWNQMLYQLSHTPLWSQLWT